MYKFKKIGSNILIGSIFATSFLSTAKITTEIANHSNLFHTNDFVDIPEEMLNIKDGVLYGFKDGIKAADILNGKYTRLTIPEGVTEIVDFAFSYMFDGISTLIDEISIPTSLKKIGSYCFYRCFGVRHLIFTKILLSQLNEVGSYAFNSCGLEYLELPNSLQIIRKHAFDSAGAFNSLIFPISLKTVEESAFANCTNLSDLDLKAYKEIPHWLYQPKYIFENVGSESTGANVVHIDNAISSEDEWKEQLETKQWLGKNETAFSYDLACSSQILPEEYLYIVEGRDAKTHETFQVLDGFIKTDELDWNKYDTIQVPAQVQKISQNFGRQIPKTPKFHLTFAGSGAQILDDAFAECTGLIDVQLPSLKLIGTHAFYGCYNIKGTVEISAEEVSGGAFEGCTGIDTVFVSQETAKFQTNAFLGCKNISTVDFTSFGTGDQPDPEDWQGNIFNGISPTGIAYLPPNQTPAAKQYWKEHLPSYGIPIDKDPIRHSYANWVTKNVDFNKITSEGFNYSSNNRKLHGPNKPLSEIEKFNVIEFNPELEYITDGAFKNFFSMGGSGERPSWEIIWHNSLLEIGNDAFYGCEGVSSLISFPKSLISIGNNAFYRCFNLRGDFALPKYIQRIGSYAFGECILLHSENLEIPNTLKYLGSNAFLDTIVPKITVKQFSGKIDDYAFNNSNLKTIDLTDYPAIPEMQWELTDKSFATLEVSVPTKKQIIVANSADTWKQYLEAHGLDPNVWEVKVKE